MTIVATPSIYPVEESDFIAEREFQRQSAASRMYNRGAERHAHEEALKGPDGLVIANEPDRLANRVDRVTSYEEGIEPAGVAACVNEVFSNSARATEAVLEKIINAADFLGVHYLDEGVEAARSVGRILVSEPDGRRAYGTGFMVSPRLLLTNHHVLPDAATARGSFVEFNYQDGVRGSVLEARRLPFAPDRFFVADRERDFALVAVDAEPEVLAAYGFNKLTAAQGTVLIGESVTIVQHPRGEKKQITLRENKVVDIPERFVHYSADTEPGSSGSPVFNDQWEVVALHHASVPAPTHSEFGGFLNEGVRISRILVFLREQNLPPAWTELLAEDLPATPSAGPVAVPAAPLPAPELRTEAEAVPGHVDITLRFNGTTLHAVATPEPAEAQHEAISIDPDYSTRKGYDPEFLGVTLPLPEPLGALAPAISPELRYHHFSIRLHRARRLAVFTAVNINGPVERVRREGDRWFLDPRLAADEQTGEAVYTGNPLDRGHLVRRLDPAWGPIAKAANDDTFHFTNSTPQHHDFNAGRTLWLGLEDYILDNADNRRLAVSVFSGPVLAADDPEYRGVSLPRQFWKIAAMVKQDGQLSVTGYLLSQAALLDEFLAGEEDFAFDKYHTFQVPVRRIADLTGLILTPHISADPLERLEVTGLAREILRPQDLIL